MQLGVAVVNWNSGGDLRRLLASLQPLASELERILVVDNGSRDDSIRNLPAGLPLEVLEAEVNLGFAVAANRAIGNLNVPLVLLVNPDVEIQADHLRRLCRTMVERPRAAIVTGRLVDRRGRPQTEFQLRPLPTPWRVLKEVLFLDHLVRRLGFSGNSPEHGSQPVPVEQPAAALWLLRFDAWKSIGGFDERFAEAWFEDVDFCKRLVQEGWQILYQPDCSFVHRGGSSLRTLGRKHFLEIYYRNMLRYLRKHHSFAYPLLWLPVRLGGWIRMVWEGR